MTPFRAESPLVLRRPSLAAGLSSARIRPSFPLFIVHAAFQTPVRTTTHEGRAPLPHASAISMSSVVCLLPPNVAQLHTCLFRARWGNEVRPPASRLALRLASSPLRPHIMASHAKTRPRGGANPPRTCMNVGICTLAGARLQLQPLRRSNSVGGIANDDGYRSG